MERARRRSRGGGGVSVRVREKQVLTTGMSIWVFLLRGPGWGLVTLVLMTLLDILIFYFG